MFFLRKYIELTAGGSVQGLDKAAEGVAHTTYAQCLKHVGDRQGAIQSLQAYLQTTSRCRRGRVCSLHCGSTVAERKGGHHVDGAFERRPPSSPPRLCT